MSETAHLTPLDQANLLAGQAVAEAEAYLSDQRDAAQIKVVADQLWRAHDTIARRALIDRCAYGPNILVPVRLLITTLLRTAHAETDEHRMRWRRVMASLADLVRHESLALRASEPSMGARSDESAR
jgi:hypothetical protein